MRHLAVAMAVVLFSTASFAKDSPKKVCFNTRVAVPIAQFVTADTARLAAEKQVPACSDYINKFKKRKKERSSEVDKKLGALLIRAKAYTILGQREAALKDIAKMQSLAVAVQYQSKLSAKYGVGLLLQTLEAINSDDPVGRIQAMVAEHPYYEAFHQIALSYAIERGDYLAAAKYATLSDKLNESASAAQLKGYLLERSGRADLALQNYQDSVPSLETYIRQSHIFLQMGEPGAAENAYQQALAISRPGRPLQQNVFALLTPADDRGNTITPSLQKRLDILKTVFTLDQSKPEEVFNQLFQQSTQFGHFELIAAMQYVGRQMDQVPEQVLMLDSTPQFPESFSPEKLRNSWINKLPKHISKGKPAGKPRVKYSSTVPLLASNGYKSDLNEDGSITVSFESSPKMDLPTITELALLRAAQLAVQKETPFFRIKDLNKMSKSFGFNDPVSYIVKMTINLSDVEEGAEKAFDARHIIDVLSPKYMSVK